MVTSHDKILIVDPFKNLLNIYRIFLEKERYRVETAPSLNIASQKLFIDHYAILISEYLPPFEETFRILHQVKERSPETYIIIVTNAIVDERAYEKLFDAGIDDFILKPYSPNKILVHVRKGFQTRNRVLEKQELERQSVSDPISRQVAQPIFNLTHFQRCLRQELKKARRHGHPLSLVLMEVPCQAMVDSRSFVEGLMVEMIKILRNNTREEDIVGRGNGSFGVLLPETDEAGSKALVKRLTNLIQDYPSFQKEEDFKSTANRISFQAFTYPEKFTIPECLKPILEELSEQSPRP